MIKIIKTTTKEFDGDGKLIKCTEVIVEEEIKNTYSQYKFPPSKPPSLGALTMK